MNSAELSPSAGGSCSRSLPSTPQDLCGPFSAKPVLSRDGIRNFDHQTDFYLPLPDLGRYVFFKCLVYYNKVFPPSSELADPVFLQL